MRYGNFTKDGAISSSVLMPTTFAWHLVKGTLMDYIIKPPGV